MSSPGQLVNGESLQCYNTHSQTILIVWLNSTEWQYKCFYGDLTNKVKKNEESTGRSSYYPSWPYTLFYDSAKRLLRMWYALWINYRRADGMMVQYSKHDQIVLLSKQLAVNWIAAGLNYLFEKSNLVCRSFLVTGINIVTSLVLVTMCYVWKQMWK